MSRGTAVTAEAVDAATLLANGARAQAVHGDLRAGRRWFETAYETAERAGDVDSMATAVLGLGGIWVHEQRDAAAIALMQARLQHVLSLLDPDSGLAGRLRVRLAAELDYRSGTSAMILATLEDTMRGTDPVARAEALSLAHHCLLGPDHGALRQSIAMELIAEGARTGRRSDTLMGLLWQTVDLFLEADPHAERRLVELRRHLARADHLAVGYVVSAIEVMLAIRAGRLDEAKTLAERCAERGAAAGDVDATGWYGGQLVAIRWYQGRIDELLPMLNELVHSPTLSAVDNSYFAALALAAAAGGDQRTAMSALATLRGTDLVNLPRSSSWMVTMSGIVEAANLLGDVELSARAYELLRPYAHLPVVVSLGVACFGSAHHTLGVAALTTGEVDKAVEHLGNAVQQNLAMGHWPAVMMSRLRYAQALALRAGPDDAHFADCELDAAAKEAAALGIELPNLTVPIERSRSQRSPAPMTCIRDGRKWRIDLGHRSALVEHGVGMLHLAVLIANPGREIPAVELVAGVAVLDAAVDGAGGSAQLVLDRTAVQQYRQRISRLRAEVDNLELNGEHERAARVRAESDWLVAELAAATGMGGRGRRFADSGERARLSVGKAIRRALARIDDADALIGQHLRARVHTGVRCSYQRD